MRCARQVRVCDLRDPTDLSLDLEVDGAQHLELLVAVLLHAGARLHQDERVAADLP